MESPGSLGKSQECFVASEQCAGGSEESEDLCKASGFRSLPVGDLIAALQSGERIPGHSRESFIVAYDDALKRNRLAIPADAVKSALFDFFDCNRDGIINEDDILRGVSLLRCSVGDLPGGDNLFNISLSQIEFGLNVTAALATWPLSPDFSSIEDCTSSTVDLCTFRVMSQTTNNVFLQLGGWLPHLVGLAKEHNMKLHLLLGLEHAAAELRCTSSPVSFASDHERNHFALGLRHRIFCLGERCHQIMQTLRRAEDRSLIRRVKRDFLGEVSLVA